MTVKEILSASQLDWEVEKVPLVHESNNSMFMDSGYYGIRRKDNQEILGVCTKQYQETQNEQMIERAMQIADQVNFDYKFSKAFAVNGGRKIFAEFEVPTTRIAESTGYKKYIYVVDSNDGSIGLSYGISNTVLSCANQLYLFASKGNTVKHTKNININADEIAGRLHEKLMDFDRAIDYSKNRSIDDSTVRELVRRVMKLPVYIHSEEYNDDKIVSKKTKNKVDKLLDCIAKETTEKGDTGWGLLNGVTYYTNHVLQNKERDPHGIEKLLFSNANKINKIAWDYVNSNL
tara:strand:+ start:188 stop:1057 length:870 start_codon:yes stop_codon:yes gene_type:complete